MTRRQLHTTPRLLWLTIAHACVLAVTQFASAQMVAPNSQPTSPTAKTSGNLPDDISEVLSWLPQETEAILVSRGNVPPDTGSMALPVTVMAGNDLPAHVPSKYQNLVASYCIDPFNGFYPLYPHPDKFIKSFFGRNTAKLFVKAVWWEKDTTRQTCDIVVFRDKTAERMVRSLAAFPNVRRNIAGVSVLEVNLNNDHGERTDPTWELYPPKADRPPVGVDRRYLAAPRPDVYLAATSSELLKTIIVQMKRPGPRRELPPKLPEWQHVDATAPFWGLRHYRKATATKDRLSMLRWDPGAEGLVFFGGEKPSPYLGWRYVSRTNDAGNRFRRMQAAWGNVSDPSKLGPMQRIGPDCVEVRIRINAPRGADVGKTPFSILSIDDTRLSIHVMLLPWLGFMVPEQGMP